MTHRSKREPTSAASLSAKPEREPFSKLRVDQLLVERGLAKTRAKAQALLASGRVHAEDVRVEKVAQRVSRDTRLRIDVADEFVSRGGHKLRGALAAFGLSVQGRVCVDIGASTGGFTDCLLQQGAQKVYAVDVGEAQLDETLAHDARVVSMDRTNARHLEATAFPEPLDLAVVDASFISIDKLLPALSRILPSGALLLSLIKPQFEAGRARAARASGVIRDPKLREELILHARECMVRHGFSIRAGVDSVVLGPEGNREHFVLAERA